MKILKDNKLFIYSIAFIFFSTGQALAAPVDTDSDGLIEINSLDDLNEIRNSNGSGRFELTRDLDFDTNKNGQLDTGDWNEGKNWIPLPSVSMFNGNGHKIRNLYLSSASPDSSTVALISSASILENIRLENVKVFVVAEKNGAYISPLAIFSTRVHNCSVEGNIEAYGKINSLTGLVSVASDISNSSFVGSIKAISGPNQSGAMAGLVIQAGTIDSSYAIVDLEATNLFNVSGLADNTNALTSSYALVDIKADSYATGLVGSFLIYNSEITSDRFHDNYVIGKISTKNIAKASSFISSIHMNFEDAIAEIRSNYSSVEITETATNKKFTNFHLGYLTMSENSSLTTSNNYWVRDPYNVVLPPAPSAPIVLGEQSVAMTDLKLMQNNQLSDAFYMGADTELPRLKTNNEYPWVSTDRPNASGDAESIQRIRDAAPQYSCDTPIDFLVKEKKSGYVFSAKTPQTFDFFNAKQGLKCSDAKQASGRCDDYEVSYLCGGASVATQWTAFSSRDNPGDGVDNESISSAVCASGSAMGIRTKAINSGIIYYGAPQIPYKFNLQKGFTCRNSDNGGSNANNTCKDYEVRMVCEGYSLTEKL